MMYVHRRLQGDSGVFLSSSSDHSVYFLTLGIIFSVLLLLVGCMAHYRATIQRNCHACGGLHDSPKNNLATLATKPPNAADASSVRTTTATVTMDYEEMKDMP